MTSSVNSHAPKDCATRRTRRSTCHALIAIDTGDTS
jgi:hypothetical protein